MKGIRNFALRRSEDIRVLEDGSFVSELVEIAFPVTGAGVVEVEPGWLYCNGAAASRATYKRLFDEIGTTYGAGDGSTTFNLPDCRGRSPLPWVDGAAGADRVANAGAVGNAVAVGGVGGNDTVSISPANLPAHVHSKGTLSIAGASGSHGHNIGTIACSSSNGTPAGTGAARSNNGGAITVNIPATVNLAAQTHVHNSADFAGLFGDGTSAGLGAGTPAHNNVPPHLPIAGMVIRS
jgi:microcystin-dependent protein